MSDITRWPGRSPQKRLQTPVDPPNSPKRPLGRGSTDGHEPRLLVRRNSGGGGAGQRRDADEGTPRRSRNRSNSVPPDNRNHHDHRPHGRDGRAGLTPVSASESWAWGENWANVCWTPGRGQVQVQAQVQVSGQGIVQGGHTEGRAGHREGADRRGRRSSDQKKRPTPALAHGLRRIESTTAEPPVIPGVATTTNRGMRFRNLLRKSSRSSKRPKILFYNKHEPHYGFTNFSPHSVVYRGKRYPTSEHLFQSFKVGVHRIVFFAEQRTSLPLHSSSISPA